MLTCRRCRHENPGDPFACAKCGALLPVARHHRNWRESGSEIVIRDPTWPLVGGLVAAFGLLLFSVGLTGSVLDEGQRPGWLGVMALGPFLVMGGIDLATSRTTIAFNEPPGYMTVAQRHILLFLTFFTTKRISKDAARNVVVHSAQRTVSSGTYTVYEVRVVTETGKEVTLYEDRERGVAQYFAERISQFGAGKDVPAPSR